MNIRRTALICALCIAPLAALWSEGAAQIVSRLQKQTQSQNMTLAEMAKQLVSEADKADKRSDSRSLYAFAGSLQEQLGLYDQAIHSYAAAAAIGGASAEGMPALSSAELVLNAVRCALSSGNYEQADSFLNSAVKNSTDPRISSYVKLYEAWSMLCRASNEDETKAATMLLESYAEMPETETVRAQSLLTLFYITGDQKWKTKLESQYPDSPETAIAQGSISVLPAPFWYFVPRTDAALTESARIAQAAKPASEPAPAAGSADSGRTEKAGSWQLGFFRSEANAQSLAQRLSAGGFTPAIREVKRSSGTVYYAVVVAENTEGTMGMLLKDAGFECYPLFE